MNAIHRAKPRYDYVILVLQGGGALGAYQAGVYEGMSEAGYAPDWITGVSIGAINGALIAGNRHGKRIEQLRAFWDLASSGVPRTSPLFFNHWQHRFTQVGAALSSVVGVPGFFVPRLAPPALMPDGDPGALSIYDAAPLRKTLEQLVDFDLINRREVRLSIGAVNVRTGNPVYFDNRRTVIEPAHVLASGALPPAFAPVEIDGEYYWDGGIVSNTPLWHAVDNSPAVQTLVVQVDLFSAEGDVPKNFDQVVERHKDIMYSSKPRFDGTRVRRLRAALQRLLQKLPRYFKADPDVKALQGTSRSRIDIVHLTNRRHSSGYAKDFEFSRPTIQELWAAGLDDARRIVAHPERLRPSSAEESIRVYEPMRTSQRAGSISGLV
jgi:NTE family protein